MFHHNNNNKTCAPKFHIHSNECQKKKTIEKDDDHFKLHV